PRPGQRQLRRGPPLQPRLRQERAELPGADPQGRPGDPRRRRRPRGRQRRRERRQHRQREGEGRPRSGGGRDLVSTDLIITNLFIFALAALVGFEVIRGIPKLLHTPLMALTNALSAIALVGSIVILGQTETTYAKVLGFIAVV